MLRSLTERNALVEQYQFLPKHVVSRMWRSPAINTRFSSFEDACQIGFLGLIRAAERWEPGRGAIFKTYAYVAIHHTVCRSIGLDCLIRVPASAMRAVSRFERDLPYVASPRTLAAARKAFHVCEIIEDTDSEPASGWESAEDGYDRRALSGRLAAALADLKPGELQLLRDRFCRDMTFTEIGQQEHRSKQAIQSRQRRVLATLRARLNG